MFHSRVPTLSFHLCFVLPASHGFSSLGDSIGALRPCAVDDARQRRENDQQHESLPLRDAVNESGTREPQDILLFGRCRLDFRTHRRVVSFFRSCRLQNGAAGESSGACVRGVWVRRGARCAFATLAATERAPTVVVTQPNSAHVFFLSWSCSLSFAFVRAVRRQVLLASRRVAFGRRAHSQDEAAGLVCDSALVESWLV